MTLSTLKIRGPFRGPSGYEHHVREFVRELHRQGVELELATYRSGAPPSSRHTYKTRSSTL